MENQLLTYEQWRERLSVSIDEDVKTELSEQGIDAEGEIETAIRHLYDAYIAGD